GAADVGGAGAAGDQGGGAVDHAVPDPARGVEALLARPEYPAPHARHEPLDRRLLQGRPAGREPLPVPLLSHDQPPSVREGASPRRRRYSSRAVLGQSISLTSGYNEGRER